MLPEQVRDGSDDYLRLLTTLQPAGLTSCRRTSTVHLMSFMKLRRYFVNTADKQAEVKCMYAHMHIHTGKIIVTILP